MPKAEALAEAKHWLRNLTRDDATRQWTDMSSSVLRGNKQPALPVASDTASQPAPPDDHPYAHPRYWAAFILIGDPN